MDWPAATEPDEDQELASYLIEVDEVEVARLSPSETSCVVTGLTANSAHLLAVSAFDTAGEWSADEQQGRLVKLVVPSPVLRADQPDRTRTSPSVPPIVAQGDAVSSAPPSEATPLSTTVPSPVTNVKAVHAGGGQLDVSWTPPAGGPAPNTYVIWVESDAPSNVYPVKTSVSTPATSIRTAAVPTGNYRVSVWSGIRGMSTYYSSVAYSGGIQVGPAPVRCVSPQDSDGDRLPDAVETNTGVFVSPGNTGTNPNKNDSDGDGLDDGDETLGTVDQLNLPSFGVSPVHKDILFEFDWFDDSLECGAHSHRPSLTSLNRVAAAYAAAPVSNPDGNTGVNMISDFGYPIGYLQEGSVVPDSDGVIAGGVSDPDFRDIRAANQNANRRNYFHYVLLPHRYDTNSSSGGQARVNGNIMIVSLQCSNSTNNIASAIFHEAGHNLGLRHGGGETVNYKPNYNSVMNYLHAWDGIDTDCTIPGNGVLDYSVGARASLTETALSETNGICGGVDIDWNGNSVIDAALVSTDINQDSVRTTLTDFNDWANINLGSAASGGASPPNVPIEVVSEDPIPLAARDN